MPWKWYICIFITAFFIDGRQVWCLNIINTLWQFLFKRWKSCLEKTVAFSDSFEDIAQQKVLYFKNLMQQVQLIFFARTLKIRELNTLLSLVGGEAHLIARLPVPQPTCATYKYDCQYEQSFAYLLMFIINTVMVSLTSLYSHTDSSGSLKPHLTDGELKAQSSSTIKWHRILAQILYPTQLRHHFDSHVCNSPSWARAKTPPSE